MTENNSSGVNNMCSKLLETGCSEVEKLYAKISFSERDFFLFTKLYDQETGSTLDIGFALSNPPYFYSAYAIGVLIFFVTAICRKKAKTYLV